MADLPVEPSLEQFDGFVPTQSRDVDALDQPFVQQPTYPIGQGLTETGRQDRRHTEPPHELIDHGRRDRIESGCVIDEQDLLLGMRAEFSHQRGDRAVRIGRQPPRSERRSPCSQRDARQRAQSDDGDRLRRRRSVGKLAGQHGLPDPSLADDEHPVRGDPVEARCEVLDQCDTVDDRPLRSTTARGHRVTHSSRERTASRCSR